MLARSISTIFIERVGNGGFIISDKPPEPHIVSSRLAAVTSLDEAMTFIRTEVWPPAVDEEEPLPIPRMPPFIKSGEASAAEPDARIGGTEWHGGDAAPVNGWVWVRFRDRTDSTGLSTLFDWGHHPCDHPKHGDDIVEYRLTE